MRLARLALPLALLVACAVLHLAAVRVSREAESPYPVARTLPFRPGHLALARAGAGMPGHVLPRDLPVAFAFRGGDTLGGVLSALGFAGADIEAIVGEVERFVDPRTLKATDTYAALVAGDAGLRGFELTLAGRGRVRVERQDGSWTSAFRPFSRRTELRAVRGRLDGAFETSMAASGGDPVAAYLLADVLQWDLDFNRDLRLDDEFEVLYERIYLDGGFDSLGSVLAATYTNRGRRLEAYRFGEPAGYYDGEGRPLEKMFLRSPLRFSRITSRFTHRRFHPILKSYRPHLGVDYGAPTGTPVRATAGGVVTFAGWDGGGGRTVKVRHPNGFLTAYLHLSGFARGVRSGQRVGQGDVIGYVGATGLATGPHLDYRVQQDGRWIDPLRIKSVPTPPLPDAVLPEFMAHRDRLREALHTGVLPDEAAAGVLASVPAEAGASAGAGRL